jgi:Tfp pilus assembly protein FimT
VARALLSHWEHNAMHASSLRGSTLVELAITILVLGPLFALSIPAFQSVSSSDQLKGATENVAAQRRLAREKAIAAGVQISAGTGALVVFIR